MSEKERFLKFISQFNLPISKINSIISLMEEVSIDNFFKIKDIDKILKIDTLENMRECSSEANIRGYFNSLDEQDIKIVTIDDKDYPKKLQGLDDAPFYLFCKGDLSLFNLPSVGIVGSRTPTNYGRIVTDRFAGELASAGAVIVSGLAYGVDSISHRKAIEVNGKTIAVLGGGFNHIYPAEHTSLGEEISRKGLLVSEYCPSVKPTKFTFPQRNRIIAGLSDALLITEAGIKSGTVHTKEFALEYGRELFSVPGNINSEKSGLTNEIIRTNQAQCVTDPKQIIELLGIQSLPKPKEKSMQLGFIEMKIVEILKNEEKKIDEIAEILDISINSLNVYLTTMEINGIIKRMPGGFLSLA